jgi:UDP-2,3-diacylglucosamine hydrolase
MSIQTDALFISDLHLTPERPLPVQLFHRFIAEIARNAQALYILGDFFEAWVGDDNLAESFNQALAETLKSLSAHGVAVYFLPGNRDFLVGANFAQAAGLTLLADPTRIDLLQVPTLLAHGDQFCTDDIAYQTFRAQVRDPAWQQDFLAQPLHQRLALAAALRERSEHAKADKKPEIMDVNNAAIRATLDAHPVKRIIHGHTHRPARHEIKVNGQIVERWVLPDWYETGGYLACDVRGCRLLPFP